MLGPNETRETPIPIKMTVEANSIPGPRPSSPEAFSKQLAGNLGIKQGIQNLTPDQRQDIGQAWKKVHQDEAIEPTPIRRRGLRSRGGWVGAAAAAVLGIVTATGLMSPSSVSRAEGITIADSAPQTEQDKNYALVKGAVNLVFSQERGPVIHPNVEALVSQLKDPEAVKGEDLQEVVNKLIKDSKEYQAKVSEREGSGDDGAGDDMKATLTDVRDINGQKMIVEVNSVGGLTIKIPTALIKSH